MVSIKEDGLPDVGVIVGRFQVPDLHEGHRDVLDFVCERHHKVIVFLGLTATKISTPDNPLDFQARKQMIAAEYPEVDVLYIEDMWSDALWSKRLDGQIANVVTPGQTVMLYGSRESFIDHYEGKHPTTELEAEHKVSGTEVRNEIRRNRPDADPSWRRGAVHAAFARFPIAYTTVDIAVFNEAEDRIALGRKPNEPMWRLPGGFSEPHTDNFEADARREVQEELNLSITDPVYIGSFRMDDWRYRGERDKIKSLLFTAKVQFGQLRGGDDIEEAKWFEVERDLREPGAIDQLIMPNHRQLVEAVLSRVS